MNIFIKYIVILFLFINYNNGQITPLTPEITTLSLSLIDPISSFSFYPPITSSDYCSIKFEVLIKDYDTSSNLDSITISDPFSYTRKFKENNYYKYDFIANTVNYGIHQINVTLRTNNSVESIYNFNFICNSLDIDFVSFTPDPISIFVGGNFISTLKVVGLPSDIIFTVSNGFTSVYRSFISPNNYYVNWDINYLSTRPSLIHDWVLEVLFPNNLSKLINFKTLYTQIPGQQLPQLPSETIYFPKDLATKGFTEFGQGYSPIFKTNILTEIVRPFQMFHSSYGHYLTQPLKGVKGNMTFCGFLKDYTTVPYSIIYITNQNVTEIKQVVFISDVKPFSSAALGEVEYLISTIQTEVPLFSFSFSNDNSYKMIKFRFAYVSNILTKSWPFGFKEGTNSQYNYSASFIRRDILGENTFPLFSFGILDTGDGYSNVITSTIVNVNPPKIKSYSYQKVSANSNLLRVNFISEGGIYFASCGQGSFIGIESLVGGSIYNGTLEFIVHQNESPSIKLIDFYENELNVDYGSILSLDPLLKLYRPFEFNKVFNISSFYNVSFLFNDLNLVDKDNYITMYLSSTDIPHDAPIFILLHDPISYPLGRSNANLSFKAIYLPLTFEPATGLFSCRLIIQKNNIFDEIQYSIYIFPTLVYNGYLPESARLRVSQTRLDNEGPTFSYIEKIGDESVVELNKAGMQVGWKLTINDDYNGFERGYVKVMGSVDSSTYYFNFTLDDAISGDSHVGIYHILINVSQPCVSQVYTITEVDLFDTNNIQSSYRIYSEGQILPYESPFYNLYNEGYNVSQVSFICLPSLMDSTPPTLSNFISSLTYIDVGSLNRTVSFDFIVLLSSSRLKLDQLPIVFLTDRNMKQVECKSKVISFNNSAVSYSCTTEIPVSFGYPYTIVYSIYGFVSNGGYFHGFDTMYLYNHGFNYHLETVYTFDDPILLSNEIFYSEDKKLIIYGRGLTDVDQVVVTYSDSNLSTQTLSPDSNIGSSCIILTGINPTSKEFLVKAIKKNGLSSNSLTINPTYFSTGNLQPPFPTKTPSPTPTTPLPTNKPQKCSGVPECGGDKQGYCSNTGCVCFTPWVGISCDSQIIIVPPPKINTTDPTIEIPTDPGVEYGNSDSNETPKALFRSLISLVSLREIRYDGNQIINHVFDKWIYTKVNDLKNQYITNIPNTNTNITATLEWFNSSTTIQFANQNLTMNPSTLKYTIEITQYKFSNQLNTLQLIISASLQSSKTNEVCSAKEFGDTTNGDNSNYLKIQIEDHSLYARFIKRAVIDGNVKSIDNLLLDSSLKILENTASSVQSFIAIGIPHFQNYVIVDPDFSVIIDSNAASSSSSNSICNLTSQKLSKSQLAGIIIGCIAFATVIVVAVVYHLIKMKNQKKFLQNMNNKLNKIN